MPGRFGFLPLGLGFVPLEDFGDLGKKKGDQLPQEIGEAVLVR
jgi:hypothetical protein